MKNLIQNFIILPAKWVILILIVIPFFISIVFIRLMKILRRPDQPKLLWGSDPIPNFKYWSNSMAKEGYYSKTLVSCFYAISKKEDFDLYFDDHLKILKAPVIGKVRTQLLPYYLFLKYTHQFHVIHHSFHGMFLMPTPLAQLEPALLKMTGCKSIVLPYGGDVYMYSKINDNSLKHVLLKSYPGAAKAEARIVKKIKMWTEYADVIIPGTQFDGIGRWDILTMSSLAIDTEIWQQTNRISNANGIGEKVYITHSPNHRGFKGTEFIINAVDKLKDEGLNIELLLLEGIPNDEVKRILNTQTDILVEQLIFSGYALSGIEGMVSGLPVCSNLEEDQYLQVMRRYTYLNECPILSTTPETILTNLRLLIKNPDLRRTLGEAGRKYVQKYHSEKAARYLFSKIYDQIWYNKSLNLIDLYHPLLKDSYNNQSDLIEHPLQKNKYAGFLGIDNKIV